MCRLPDMKKYLFLIALWLAFLVPTNAFAFACFWVGGTGTWDSSSITHWAPSSGGAATGCATSNAAPAAGDTVTFDASSGGGTVTPNGTVAGIAFTSITAGAFTGTLAFNTNNPNMTFGSVSFGGSGTRTINMGSGTWTITGTSGTIFDVNVQTNCTSCVYSNASFVFSGNSAARAISSGSGLSFGPATINANSTKGYISISGGGGSTWASVTVGSGNTLAFGQGVTHTITGALTMTGTSSAPVGLQSFSPGSGVTTVSVGSASTINWGTVLRVTKSGAGSITATNSFDAGGNTSVTITAPSAGGGGGRIIGG